MAHQVRLEIFEWDYEKEVRNIAKHGIGFEEAALAFRDPNLILEEDITHSPHENRWFCFGKVGQRILTVRFTYRGKMIRILGAGAWRKGRKVYEKENPPEEKTK